MIAVITFLVNASGFIDGAFDRMNPINSRNSFGPFGGSLTSFEAFRATSERERPTRTTPPTQELPDTLTTAQLRERYEALRGDHQRQAIFQANRQLVKNGLLMLLSIALFGMHWRWLRRLSSVPSA